jgi:hypothetical protein
MTNSSTGAGARNDIWTQLSRFVLSPAAAGVAIPNRLVVPAGGTFDGDALACFRFVVLVFVMLPMPSLSRFESDAAAVAHLTLCRPGARVLGGASFFRYGP